MNREIKFRVWDKMNEEMLNIQKMSFKTKKILPYGWNIEQNEDRFELMQYIGLKDKNDKEIYEKDIIRIKYTCINPKTKEKIFWNVIAEVKYLEDHACFGYLPIGSKVWQNFRYKIHEGFQFEIIGNIYKNSDLLKESL